MMRKPTGWVVGLTISQRHQAGKWANDRQTRAMLDGKPDAHGYDGEGLDIHELGILAEMGFAQLLGRSYQFTNGVYQQIVGDVGPYEIRARSQREWALIVRPHDRDESVYVEAIPFKPRSQPTGPQLWSDIVKWIRYPGWIYGHEAKCFPLQDATGTGRKKVHWVPQVKLHPMETLPANQRVEIGLRPMGDTVELRAAPSIVAPSMVGTATARTFTAAILNAGKTP